MSSTIRTVRLGVAFMDTGRAIIIRWSRARTTCACGMSFHQIDTGDLFARILNPRTSEYERWHLEHLEHLKLIVVDKDGNEVVRFGC